jgi:hypothetical protein
MLTYLPLYFQNGLRYTPLVAGLLMLPMATPLFAVPRVVAHWLAPRWSGRALLSSGLVLIGIGLLWSGTKIRGFAYCPILLPMLIATCGAGILNGETTRVGMTVIPVDRAGMASGVSGTVKFSGLVIGFAALGAIFYSSVSASLALMLPGQSVAVREELTRAITGGNLVAVQVLSGHLGGSSVAQSSFGIGYRTVLMVAGTLALIAAVLSWLLINPAETAPFQGTRSGNEQFD